MKFALNLIWFFLGGGILSAALWLLSGMLLAVTIVGLPFAFAAFRIAGFAAFPFGRRLVDAEWLGERTLPGTGLANLLWVVLAGVWLSLMHIIAGTALLCTLAGIPFGLAHFKLAMICFAPLGKRVVSSEMEEALQRSRAEQAVQNLKK